MKPERKIKLVILAAKLAHEILSLITMDSESLCKLQFRQIVEDFKALEDHIRLLP